MIGPKRADGIMKTHLQKKEETGILQRMQWSPQSPDLNIIEGVWDYLDEEKVQKRMPTNLDHLWNVFEEAWNIIPQDYILQNCLKVSREVQWFF